MHVPDPPARREQRRDQLAVDAADQRLRLRHRTCHQ
jgi:hypothetical protein